MSSGHRTDSYRLETVCEPWPNDVKLFQPYEVDQMLLPDKANCFSVQAFFRFHGLQFKVEPRTNAEFMSPSGTVPFIKCGNFVISDLEPIVGFIKNKGIQLYGDMQDAEIGDMRVYMELVKHFLYNAQLYLTWVDQDYFNKITRQRYGSVYPWPLNYVLPYQKRWRVKKKLKAINWLHKDIQQVYEEVGNCCRALSDRLADHTYFFNNRPTELDAMVFGHMYSLMSSNVPETAAMVGILKNFTNLINFYNRNLPSVIKKDESGI